MKPTTLYRRTIALLTTVLLPCACVIASQQQDVLRWENRDYFAKEPCPLLKPFLPIPLAPNSPTPIKPIPPASPEDAKFIYCEL